MFGREKTSAPAAAVAAPATSTKEGGKGRPTPSRREAEKRNRTPLIGAAPPPRGETRAERKIQRSNRRAAVAQQRLAASNGDERAMNPRDQGPVKRFVRDYVDARRNAGEFLLPVTVVSFLFSTLPATRIISLFILYAALLATILDTYLLRRRMLRLVEKKFGEAATAGIGKYVLTRAIQFRRARIPKPQVQRGQFPAGSKGE